MTIPRLAVAAPISRLRLIAMTGLIAAAMIDASVAPLMGQEASQRDNPKLSDADLARLEGEFQKHLKAFRQTVTEVQAIGVKYLNAPTYDDADPYLERFDRAVEQGNRILEEKLIPAAMAIFDARTDREDEINDELYEFVIRILNKHFDDGNYQRAYQLANRLLQLRPDEPFAAVTMVRAGLLTNRFGPPITQQIRNHREYFQQAETLSEVEKNLLNNAAPLREWYQREQEIRAAETRANDLPRVLFKTSKGEFVIELFENEAPQTVANFIELVESGHYDGLLFHVVIDQLAAETGVVTADRQIRNVDYRIEDESKDPDIRLTFAGSVVMSENRPDFGSCRFFIALATLPAFNGKQTVFGRVISGMDTVYRLNKTFKIEEQQQIEIEGVVPDRVISATVLRKRDHPYRSAKLKMSDGKLP